VQWHLLWLDALRPLAQLKPDGSLDATFHYGDRPNVPEALERGGKLYRILTDHLGSVRVVVDTQTGQIVQEMEYDAWGRVTQDTNPGFQPFGYAGGLYDADTGLTRFGARDYDGETGRWTAKDPILFGGGSVGLFAYVEGNPVSLTDPLGLATYMCTQPLHALGAAGRMVYSPSSNPLYHQFIGIIRPDGSVITGGQDREAGPWGPGRPSEGDGAPGAGAECKKVEDDNQCIEQCLMGKFSAPRPRYSLALQGLTGGQNCQGWANSTLAQCQASCKAKQ
jgi:RHS repeat-associated protein